MTCPPRPVPVAIEALGIAVLFSQGEPGAIRACQSRRPPGSRTSPAMNSGPMSLRCAAHQQHVAQRVNHVRRHAPLDLPHQPFGLAIFPSSAGGRPAPSCAPAVKGLLADLDSLADLGRWAPTASSASASRSLAMICSAPYHLRFMSSLLARLRRHGHPPPSDSDWPDIPTCRG